MINKANSVRILIISFLLVVSVWVCASAVYAEAGSVRVYLTMSRDGDFVTGQDGTVMAHVPIDVSYFDLDDYGLGRFKRYEAAPFDEGGGYINDKVVEQPTLLHLYIKALEQYYLGRHMTADDIHSSAFNFSETISSPTSFYLTQFWGHDENFMYFVNHEYPLMAAGRGSTCDYILLYDGYEIDVASYTDWNFRFDGAFSAFDRSGVSLEKGDSLTLTLTGVPTYGSSEGETIPPSALPDEDIRISSDRGKTWVDSGETTDSNGQVTLTFNEAGTYYVSAGTDYANYEFTAPPICVVTVDGGSIDPPPGPGPDPGPDPTPDPAEELAKAKGKAKTELAEYKDPSLYRAAQQKDLSVAVEKGSAEIDAAEDKEGIDAALSAAKATIDLIKTDAELTEEERKAEEERRKEEERKAKEEAIQKASELLTQVSGLDAGSYTAESYKAVSDAKAALEALLSKEDSASTEILAAREALEQAVSGLVQMKQNTLKVTRKNKTFRVKTLKKASKSYKAVTVKGAKGKVTYKISGNKKSRKALKFNKKNGKITVKKGTKKGTYKLKIRVKAAGTALYKAGSKTVTVKVRVK